MMTYQEIYNETQKQAYFDKHHRVLIAVSGGVDSMNLLHFLHLYQEDFQIRIGIAHVNHKQRAESDMEETYLRAWAQDHNIPIYISYFEGKFSEKAARDWRYKFFQKIMKREGYSALVTAHHLDDQAETIMMRLIRGSRLRHLSGIKSVQSFGTGQLIRPFLSFSKTDLPKIFHFEDTSNEKTDFLRNRIRKNYLPLLNQENPQFVQGLNQLAFENNLLFQAFTALTSKITVTNLVEFHNQPISVQYFLLQNYLENFPDLHVKKSQFKQLLHLIQTAKQGYYPLKSGYYLLLDQLSFKIDKILPETEFIEVEKVLKYNNVLQYRDYRFRFTEEDSQPPNQIGIPLYHLSPITLRKRQKGDRISFGHFSKKLRRLFIDGKFSIADRQKAIIGEQEGKIIFVLIGDKTYLRKACKHDIMLAKLYIDKLEKR
ncbi:tRNA lysidine(34) synthetase TilS [Streptococcus canis]|uniref:tRNA lysidine(34) synthetase TilS n=1 Tax=Streptococcus canis TaxID=1329 RepID=UPI002F96E770